MTESLYRQALLRTATGLAATLLATVVALAPAIAGNATLNVVLVLDGLRPDSITADETPNLWRLRQEGVNFLNGHAVFPTVTRANATAMAPAPIRTAMPSSATRCMSEPSIPTARLSMTTI